MLEVVKWKCWSQVRFEPARSQQTVVRANPAGTAESRGEMNCGQVPGPFRKQQRSRSFGDGKTVVEEEWKLNAFLSHVTTAPCTASSSMRPGAGMGRLWAFGSVRQVCRWLQRFIAIDRATMLCMSQLCSFA
jgi:hypothetical protein